MLDEQVPSDGFTMGTITSALAKSGILTDEESAVRGRDAEQWKELAILFDDVIHELNEPSVESD